MTRKKFGPKLVFWWPIGLGAVAVLVGVLSCIVLPGVHPVPAVGVPLCFFSLFALYSLHLMKCGVEITSEQLCMLAPEKRQKETVLWRDITLYRALSWDEWRKSGGLLRRFTVNSSDGLLYGNDKVIVIKRRNGKDLTLFPFYRGNEEVVAAFERLAPAANRRPSQR